MIVGIIGSYRTSTATTIAILAALAAAAADTGEDIVVRDITGLEKETTTYSACINLIPRFLVAPKDPHYHWERPLKKRLPKNRLPKNRLPLFSKTQNLKRYHGIPRSHSNRPNTSLRD